MTAWTVMRKDHPRRSPHTTEQWWKEVNTDATGDQAVLTTSTLGQFQTADDGFVRTNVRAPEMEAQPGEKLNHRGLLETVTGESTILDAIGVPYQSSQISTGLVAGTAESLKNTILIAARRPGPSWKSTGISERPMAKK